MPRKYERSDDEWFCRPQTNGVALARGDCTSVAQELMPAKDTGAHAQDKDGPEQKRKKSKLPTDKHSQGKLLIYSFIPDVSFIYLRNVISLTSNGTEKQRHNVLEEL